MRPCKNPGLEMETGGISGAQDETGRAGQPDSGCGPHGGIAIGRRSRWLGQCRRKVAQSAWSA
jgi:hypothetical protein